MGEESPRRGGLPSAGSNLREAWLGGLNEAFKAAVDGAPIGQSLEALTEAGLEQFADASHCAFYLANSDGTTLHHVAGMPDSYAEKVDGFKIGTDSLACGLAFGSAEPVITPDVRKDPKWTPWRWLAEEFGYRGCWSFPIETVGRQVIGTFAIYFPEPASPSPHDFEVAHSVCAAASLIIVQNAASEELRDSEDRLATFFAHAPIGLSEIDADGRFLRANDELCAMLGCGREELLKLGIDDVTHPDDLAKSAEVVARVMRTGTTETVEKRYVGCSGRGFPASSRIARLSSRSRESRLLVVTEDLTERQRVEKELRDAESHQRLLLGELQHRVRNTLGVVRAIARRTADTSASAEDMLAHFQGRLDAFSRVQAAVTQNAEGKVGLVPLIENELVAHVANGGKQVRFEGEDLQLEPKAAERLSLAIHELTTNAVKHGALANRDGRLHVKWERKTANGIGRLWLSWKESGVETNGRKLAREGFGMELLRRSLPYDLNAETEVELEPDGLRFELSLPLRDKAPGD